MLHSHRLLGADPWDDWTYRWDDAGPLTAAVQSRVFGQPIRTIGHTCIAFLYWQFGSEWKVNLDTYPALSNSCIF